MVKGSTAIAVVFVMLGATAVGMFTSTDEKPVLEEKEGWGTVSYEIPTDGSTPLSHSGLENIGYMARRLKEQPAWYSEMHGNVNTVIQQQVSTYKQYSDGVLISTDISNSSMINTAKQLCFVGDSVLWREAATGASEWDGVNTEWKTDEPTKVSVEDFKVNYGLPGTEFSVYILNEDTVTSWGEVIDNGDGTYSQSFVLNHETDKAPFYYRQQMLKTGGLSAWPEFSEINVTYTFDSSWQILKSEIFEAYGVTMGPINTTCTAAYTTVYEYGTERCASSAYNDYFCNYEDKPATEIPEENDPTAVGCLTSAFGSVLAGPTVFDVSLTLNGTPLTGSVYADINNMDIRAQFGSVKLWFTDNVVYLSYGNVKARMSVEQLTALISDLLPAGADASAGIDTNELLGQLGNGEFIFGNGSASLSAKLSLMGMELPVEFAFLLDEDNNASLDCVNASVNMAGLSLDASLTYGRTEIPALSEGEKQGYVELVPYVQSLIELFTSETLSADISYTYGDVCLSGKVGLSLKEKKAAGTLTVTYDNGAARADKIVTFGYVGGNVYLNLDGVKVCANANEAIALVTGFVNLPETDGFDLGALLNAAFTDDFAGNFSASEEDGTLSVAIKGTELLKALGIEFGLGEVELSVGAGSLTANALGAEIAVTAGEGFGVDTEGYTDILPYANNLIELFKNDYFQATVAYEDKNFSVDGTIDLRKADFAAAGDITLTVGKTVKNISVLYSENALYLAVDGLKVKADVKEAVALVMELTGMSGNADLAGILTKVLSLDFGEVIGLKESEEGDALIVTVAGTRLLNALGVNFALGEVALTAESGSLTASALGAEITLAAGEQFPVEAEGYYADVTPVLKKLPAIMKAGAVSFGGLLDLTLGGAEITFDVKEGAIGWSDGIKVYLNARLCVLGTMHDIALYADNAGVSFAYGAVGAALKYEELPDLESAFISLYNRIKAVVDEISEAETSPMPAIASMKDLLAQLGAGADLSASLKNIDVGALLGKLDLREPELGKGLLAAAFGGLYLELADETAEGGFLGGVVRYRADKISLSGEVHFAAPAKDWAFPNMPEIPYLGVADFAETFDYIGAAAELLTQKNMTLGVKGTVASADTEKYPDGVKYDVDATLSYHSGATFPVHVDLAHNNVYLNTDMYLRVEASLAPRNAADDGFFFEAYLLDCNPDGTQDGTLDIYLSVSKFAKGAQGSEPLKLYAPADEIMTLLSAAVSALGVDGEAINGILISKWLDAETADQLRALGASLVQSSGLRDILNKFLGGMTAKVAGLFTASAAEEETATAASGFFKSVSLEGGEGAGSLSVVLDSSAIYGQAMPSDITLTVSKAFGEGGSYLTGVSLGNVYGDKTAAEKTDISLSFAYDCTKTTPEFTGYYDLNGIDELLKTIVNSATHVLKTEQGEIVYGEDGHRKYALNEQFYIDGQIKISAGISATVTVRGLSIRVDENDNISMDLGISYNKFTGLIKAKSDLDLTMKDGMVYMKRVAEADGAPEVLYRVMPLQNFASDILEQLIFIFNFDNLIANSIRNSAGSGSAPSEGDSPDYGALVKQYLTQYAYTAGGEQGGDKWNVTLNGGVFTGSLLGDINIGFAADKSHALRSLSVLTKLYSIVTIQGDLAFRNPCNVWDKGVTVKTEDIHSALEQGLGRALREADWEKQTYIEGSLKELFFVVNGEDAGSQSVVVGPSGELYADVLYPDLTGYEKKPGYTLTWTKKINEDAFEANATAYASYVPDKYTVTLESEREIDGYAYDEARGVWTYSFLYEYGTPLNLPARAEEDKLMRVAAFTDGAGNAVSDGANILSDTVLTAIWEYIDYTVTYTADGKTVGVQTAHYGDALEFPQAPEREGYTFTGWSAEGTVAGDTAVSAQYEANVYNVTLTSKYRAEGFTPADGGYEKSIAYKYGTVVTLPVGEEQGGYILASFKDGDGKAYTEIKNILSDISLTAEWEEIAYKVSFTADGVLVGTRNFKAGEHISSRGDLPAVPAKDGYTGEWNFVTDEVNGDMTVEAVYTPNTYTVTLVSEYQTAGYTAGEAGYVSSFGYVYGTAAVQLNASLKIPKYDFGGYYTQKDGKGEKVTEIKNILSDTVLYLHWIDNTVAVTVYSDVPFDGADGKDTTGHYKAFAFNDDYAFGYAPVSEGNTLLGMYAQAGGAWAAVSDVRAIDKTNGNAVVWAVWAKNLAVTVTEYYPNDYLGSFERFNIGGKFAGGTVNGEHGELICAALGITVETKVEYQVILDNGQLDALSGGKDYPVTGNAFKRTEMNCGNSLFYSLDYGGATVTRTFKMGGTVLCTMSDRNYISLASYKVIYVDKDGDQIQAIENVRNGYYRKTTLGMLGMPAVPAERGYKGAWSLPADTVVNSDLTVEAVYTANYYDVTFTSKNYLDGWDEENGLYVKKTSMAYDTVVNFYADGTSFASAKVSDGGNVFALPAIPEKDGVAGEWTQIDLAGNYGAFYAEYPVGEIVYSSAIAFTYEGETYTSYRVNAEENPTLIAPDTVNGYTFLGWYDKNKGWIKKDSLTPADIAYGAELEALWLSDAKVTVTGSRSYHVSTKYDHKMDAKLEGGVLVGAFASEAEISVSYRYYANNNTDHDPASVSNQKTNTYTDYRTADSFTNRIAKKSYGHAVVTVTYTYNGLTFTTGEVHGYVKY